MQTTAMGTVANSLPKNEIILLTLLISDWYIPYTDLIKKAVHRVDKAVGRKTIHNLSTAFIAANGKIGLIPSSLSFFRPGYQPLCITLSPFRQPAVFHNCPLFAIGLHRNKNQ